jgi:AbrB family looped-hinge helix DNA binding protein
MTTVKVSPKFQVVIPLEIRKRMRIRPGRKLQVFQFENRIEMIPVETIENLRGSLRGIDTTVEREEDRI